MSSAQLLKRPLRYIPADSVMTWGNDASNFLQLALSVAPDANPFVARLTVDDWKKRSKLLKAWEKERGERNLIGGTGHETNEGQTLAAAANYGRAAKLLLLTGRAEMADFMERSLYNALLATALDSSALSLERSVAAGILGGAGGQMYALDGNALYVNFYANSTARIPYGGGRGFVLDQITIFPSFGEVKFRFTRLPRSGERIRLCFRAPQWSGGINEIRINGHEIEKPVLSEAGYYEIERAWYSQDELRVVFPLSRNEAQPNRVERKGMVSLQYGPFVYAFTPMEPDKALPSRCSLLPTAKFSHTELLSQAGGTIFRSDLQQGAVQVPFLAIPYADAREGGVLWMEQR